MHLLAFLVLTVTILTVLAWKARRYLEKQGKELRDAETNRTDGADQAEPDAHANSYPDAAAHGRLK